MASGERICSFPPVVDGESRVLVLGTMPGAESLRRGQYYGHGRNGFWTILFALYGLERPDGYAERIRFLHDRHIALWDMLDSCVRPGSADADISLPEPNDIPALLREHPNIAAIFLNGNKAAALFKKYAAPRLKSGYTILTLPSTSPAYVIPFERKLEGWRKLSEHLSRIK